MKFRVYYSDDEYDGPVENTPQWDVIAVVQPDPEMGRAILQSWDFYLYANGEWYGVEGMVDYVEHTMTQPIERIIKGRRIPTPEYREIIRRAHNDPDFPRKSSHNTTEVGKRP